MKGQGGTSTNNCIGLQGAKSLSWTSYNFGPGPEDITGKLHLDSADTFFDSNTNVAATATIIFTSLIHGLLVPLPDPYQ